MSDQPKPPNAGPNALYPMRESRVTAISRAVVDRLAAGLRFFSGAASPASVKPNTNVPATMINMPTGPGVAPELRREPWFGPGQPQNAMAPRQDVAGRRFDFPSTYNIQVRPPRDFGISFEMLKHFASYDLVAIAIETRKDQMAKLEWSILPKVSQADEVRKPADDRCVEVQTFLAYPDRRTNWLDWQRMVMDEALITDAVSIYVRPTVGGKPYSLDLISGATIVPKLDTTGRAPEAPAPAYQQVLKGVPAANYTVDEFIYAPRNKRIDKVYGYCYSADTEILSRRGWVLFSELTPDDVVATRNMETKAFEWQKPTACIAEPYSGRMLHFTSRAVDLLVTPDHRVLLDSMPSAANGGKKRGPFSGEVIVAAKDVALGHTPMNKIPTTSTWQGHEIGPKVFALQEPEGTIDVVRKHACGRIETYTRRRHRGNERPLTISGDDYCALMGAYLAEGNLRTQGGIEIAQRATSKGYEAYALLLERILGAPASHCGRAFALPRRGLSDHFRQFGRAHEKFIPDEIMDATPRQLRLFWDHYVLGDGYFSKSHNQSGRGRGSAPGTRITTVSRRMADQLVEIAQKLGWSASVRRRESAGTATIVGNLCKVRDSYVVSVRYSKAMGFTIEDGTYEGIIHCVTVPNGIVYVRRNGKPAWCGNSPVEQILLTINIAIRRDVSKLQYYTEGNVPEALATVPPDWAPETIQQFQDQFDAMMADRSTIRKIKWIPPGSSYIKTRSDESLTDPYDEWLARIICYTFSLPNLPFVKTQNRATAETAYETALEEGLQPWMSWFKGIMDRIIQVHFGYADLEFVWDAIDEVDPAEQEVRDLSMIQQGVKSIDEVRAAMGLAPIGMGHAIWGIGPAGIMFVDDLLKAKAQGLLQIQPPAPPPMMGAPGMPPGMPPGTPPGLPAPPGAAPMLSGPASGDPGFVDAGQPAPGSPGAPAMASPQSDLASVLDGIPPGLLAAVGLGPAGRAGRAVDVTDDDELESDPLRHKVAHPQVLKTLRAAERRHGKKVSA